MLAGAARVFLFGAVVLAFSTAVQAEPAKTSEQKAASERKRLLKKGQKQAAAKQFVAAEKSLRELQGKFPGDPEVIYEYATVLAKQKRLPDAAKVLEPLGSSTHPEAAVYRVEARLSETFAELRADPVFRQAVGIEPPANFKPTIYERLVATGGKWEQPGQSCDSPLVKVDFGRAPKRKFEIVIETECRGEKEKTRFAGTWLAKDPSSLELTFPNPGGKTETLSCQIENLSGEDQVLCGKGTDLEFQVLSVRR